MTAGTNTENDTHTRITTRRAHPMNASTADDRSPRRTSPDPWREAFILELRTHDVPGSRIGDALVEVETYCQDTGQDPAEGFGDPEEYARALVAGLPPTPQRSRLESGGYLGAAIIIGLSLLLAGFDGLTGHHHAVFSWGALASAAVLSAVLVLVAPVLTRLLQRRYRFWLGGGVSALLALSVVTPMLLPGTALTLPALPTAIIGGVLFVAVLVALHATTRSGVDRVVDPRTGIDLVTVPRWVAIVMPGLLLVTALIVLALLVLFPSR